MSSADQNRCTHLSFWQGFWRVRNHYAYLGLAPEIAHLSQYQAFLLLWGPPNLDAKLCVNPVTNSLFFHPIHYAEEITFFFRFPLTYLNLVSCLLSTVSVLFVFAHRLCFLCLF